MKMTKYFGIFYLWRISVSRCIPSDRGVHGAGGWEVGITRGVQSISFIIESRLTAMGFESVPSMGCNLAFFAPYERWYRWRLTLKSSKAETVPESDHPAKWSWILSFIASLGVAICSKTSIQDNRYRCWDGWKWTRGIRIFWPPLSSSQRYRLIANNYAC